MLLVADDATQSIGCSFGVTTVLGYATRGVRFLRAESESWRSFLFLCMNFPSDLATTMRTLIHVDTTLLACLLAVRFHKATTHTS